MTIMTFHYYSIIINTLVEEKFKKKLKIDVVEGSKKFLLSSSSEISFYILFTQLCKLVTMTMVQHASEEETSYLKIGFDAC